MMAPTDEQDLQAVAVVLALRHRIGNRHSCDCGECRALKRVSALAREAVDMKRAKRYRATRHRADGTPH